MIWRIPGAIFFLGLCFLSGLGLRAEARMTRVAIPAPSISQIAFYAGIDKGYYQEEGLEVQLILMRAPIANVAVIAGEAQFSTVPTGALGAALKGAPVRILSATFQRPLHSLMVKSNIQGFTELKGKKVGTSGIGTADDVLTEQLFSRSGLVLGRDSPRINVGDSASRLTALISGVIDATPLVLPWNLRAMEGGFREIVRFTTQDLVLFVGSIVTNETLLKSDPAMVEKFVRGTTKGLLYARANRAGTIPILSRNIKVSDELSAKMYDIALPAMTRNGVVTADVQKRFLELMLKVQGGKESPPLETLFDFSWAQKANAELEAKGWRP
jgi:ABC-type nitrate/sulfonate/bicarbonate transport system substrate-binding protein